MLCYHSGLIQIYNIKCLIESYFPDFALFIVSILLIEQLIALKILIIITFNLLTHTKYGTITLFIFFICLLAVEAAVVAVIVIILNIGKKLVFLEF